MKKLFLTFYILFKLFVSFVPFFVSLRETKP